jgi:hypothetical protein
MIYVDELVDYPPAAVPRAARSYGTRWCHLWTDPGNEEALHTFAAGIGMRRAWFQNRRGFPHYDLVPGRRAVALAAGAVPSSLREWVKQQFELSKN